MQPTVIRPVLAREPGPGVACPIVWDTETLTDAYGWPLREFVHPTHDADVFPTGAVRRDGPSIRFAPFHAGPYPLWPRTSAGIRLALWHDEVGERALCRPDALDPLGWWADDND